MLRKTILALAALGALGALALAPTAASAGGKHGGHHGGHHGHHGKHWGHGGYGPGFGVSLYNPYLYAGGCYKAKRLVETPWGLKVRYVTVCN